MEDSLFTTELPLVNTDKELEKVKTMYPKYDPYFITCGCIKEQREKIEKLWKNFKPYTDRHFLNQIKTNFHQRSWEMYVGNVLLEKKLSIKSQNEGPDFVVNDNIYIECIAPTRGDPSKPNSVPEVSFAKTPDEFRLQDVPVDPMILRITQAIKDKALDQYEKWKSKNWFDKKAQFIIAVNTGDLQHVEESDMPNVIKALFGVQFMQINLKNGKISYSRRDIINKSSNEPVPVNYFLNDSFSFVSGVLFSSKTVINHPDNIGADCIFVNNPFSKYPVNKNFSELFNNWHASKNENGINLKRNYKLLCSIQ